MNFVERNANWHAKLTFFYQFPMQICQKHWLYYEKNVVSLHTTNYLINTKTT